ncbi:hypothetical protein QFZ77_002410 [Paenibacillus sp. V4I3]|nr:hypothetical protein [Paenibacillus sp. V4I3]
MDDETGILEIANIFEEISDLPLELQEKIKLFYSKIDARKKYLEQSPGNPSSPHL